jgi:hypothetical protein
VQILGRLGEIQKETLVTCEYINGQVTKETKQRQFFDEGVRILLTHRKFCHLTNLCVFQLFSTVFGAPSMKANIRPVGFTFFHFHKPNFRILFFDSTMSKLENRRKNLS